ncbi:iron-containing alcohol dehydrogenase [Solibacillus sp. FSL R5-0691]|uniref:iron-containing alcohol dehydrogenase n=1 Tax=Solibacillus sp. FSL R5-0691 TaxID=2921653 RepID=UPI0030CB9A16
MINELFLPKKIVTGIDSFQRLSAEIDHQKMKRPFIIYSKSAIGGQLNSLKHELPDTHFYEISKGEPTTVELQRALGELAVNNCDGVIAIGGGSVIDLAKAVAVFAVNPNLSLNDIPNLTELHRLPFIAVPTTAGTGSEATKVTVITDEKLQKKLNPAHPSFIPDVVILDAMLTVDVPPSITSFTALDALTHAIEAFVSTKANAMSDFYAKEAISCISKNIEMVFEQPHNLEARQQLLMGSFYAGIAFSNSSTNLAHATGRALGVKFHMPHGQCVALMHPFVIQYSLESAYERYEEIAKIIGLNGTQFLSGYLDELNRKQHIWKSAQQIAPLLTDEAIEQLADQALSGNGILTNRKVPSSEEIEVIFKQLRKRLQIEGGIVEWQQCQVEK